MKSLLSSFLGTFLIQAMTMLSGILTARLLLPAGKGELTAIILWPTLLTTLGSIGIWDAIVFHAASLPQAERRRLFGAAMGISIALAVAVATLGFFWLPALLSKHPPEVSALARTYLWYVPLTFLAVSAMGILQGLQQFTYYNLIRISVYFFEVIGIVVLYFLDRATVTTVILVMLISRTLTALSALVCVMRLVGMPVFGVAGSWGDLLRYGIRVHVGTMADSLNLRLDQMLMSVFLAAQVLGLYVVAVSIGAGVTLVATTLNIVLFPRLSAERSPLDRWILLGRFFRLGMLLSGLGAVALFLASPLLIRWFFGADFDASVPMARVLIAAGIVSSANLMLTTAAKAFNLPGIASRAQIVGLVFTGVFLVLLLPRFQGYGAAWASLAAYTATCIYLIAGLRGRLGFPLRELFVPRASDWFQLQRLAVELKGWRV